MGFQEDSRKVRESLERQSPSSSRRNLANILNDAERQRAASAGGLDAIIKVRDAYGSQNPFRSQVRPNSNFEIDARDPGNQPGNYGGFEEGAPRLSAGRVSDAEGRLRSADARARDLWASGRVKEVPVDWMLSEAKRLIAEVGRRTYGRKPI